MDRSGPNAPRLLLVEDEPASCLFLQAAAAALPAQVDTATRLSEAHALACAHEYSLWMIDANLPDGDGGTLLGRLRARGLHTPAIAHTAACDAAERQRLLAQGFMDVAIKPLSAAAWQEIIRAALAGRIRQAAVVAGPSPPGQAPAPVWDDQAAARALGGNPTHVAALRDLFLAELPGAREQVVTAARTRDHEGLRGALHRLRASAGFVGAARLDHAVQTLQALPDDDIALEHFISATEQTFAASKTEDVHP